MRTRRVGSWLLAVALATMVISAGVGVAGSGETPRPVEVVYVAAGFNFPDALGAGPAAGLDQGPILLVQQSAIPAETLAELNRLRPRLIVIVGGTAAVSASVQASLEALSFDPTVIRLAGSNRYATAAQVSQHTFPCGDGTTFVGYGRDGAQCRAPLSGLWSLQVVDASDQVGDHASLVLDGFGHPVIVYKDHDTNGDFSADLKLVHCNDAACFGGDESIEVIDVNDSAGNSVSLVLDSDGHPVISHYDNDATQLLLTHCNDPNCAGGDESTESVDNTGSVGSYSSLILDSNGYPVIAYRDEGNADLKLAHCNDPNCDGGNESIETLDGSDIADFVGLFPVLVLDAAGFPVIAYFDSTDFALELTLMHCNDPNCDGDNESIEIAVTTGNHDHSDISLALDATGNPTIAFYHGGDGDLRLVHCNDPNCDGGNESNEAVDTTGTVGQFASLVLDEAGNPVIAYHDASNGYLKLARCNDPNCDGGNEIIRLVDILPGAGIHNSLVLDASGDPVIAYFDDTNDFLMLAST